MTPISVSLAFLILPVRKMMERLPLYARAYEQQPDENDTFHSLIRALCLQIVRFNNKNILMF